MLKLSPMSSKPFTIPWKFLLDSNDPKIAPQNNLNQQPKTLAQALTTVCDIPQSKLPKHSVKGDDFSIAIPKEEHKIGLESCKNNLHVRILWPKGSTRLTMVALRDKLKLQWKHFGKWGITSLGKGFYELCFSSLEDVNNVISVGSWNLNPDLLKLFSWSKDFNPNTQQNTSAQVWLHIFGLSQEYWSPKILFAIASSVGSPLCSDAATSQAIFL